MARGIVSPEDWLSYVFGGLGIRWSRPHTSWRDDSEGIGGSLATTVPTRTDVRPLLTLVIDRSLAMNNPTILTSRTRLFGAVLFGLLAITASACSSPAPGIVGSQDVKTTPAKIWENTELDPMSAPRAVGDAVVLVDKERDGTLALVGLDSQTGKERWRFGDFSHSSIPAGIAVGFASSGNDVIYLRGRRGTQTAQAARINATTGELVSTSSVESFVNAPTQCTDDEDICLTSSNTSTHQTWLLTREGDLQPLPAPPGRPIGLKGHLLDNLSRDHEQMVYVDDTWTTKWSVDLQRAFGFDRSTDGGWTFHSFDSDRGDVIVGSVGPEYNRITKGAAGDKSRDAVSTAGIDRETGEILWQQLSTEVFCRTGLGEHPIRCKYQGTVIPTNRADSDPAAKIWLERFDPATGHTEWRTGLGTAPDLTMYDVDPDDFLKPRPGAIPDTFAYVSEEEIMMRTGAKQYQIINVVNGQTRDGVGVAAWCRTMKEVKGTAAGGTNSDTLYGRGLLEPCAFPASTSNAEPSAPTFGDADSGDPIYVATPTQVTAYE